LFEIFYFLGAGVAGAGVASFLSEVVEPGGMGGGVTFFTSGVPTTFPSEYLVVVSWVKSSLYSIHLPSFFPSEYEPCTFNLPSSAYSFHSPISFPSL